MNATDTLSEVVAAGRTPRPAGEGIYSVLPEGAGGHGYDRRAAVYDAVVGTEAYNRVMWGASRRGYEAFARRALASGGGGLVLDAPCGSLLFSAAAYAASGGRVVALDQSLGMLRRARARLAESAGAVPEGVVFLQADLADLPFRAGSFDAVLSMNVLHLYRGDAGALVSNLGRLLKDGGRLYLTSLVRGGRLVGDSYLRLLHGAGEFVRPRSEEELRGLLEKSLGQKVACGTRGNMAYATAAVRRA
jgi:SAM-dependent methyltransferase